MGKKKSKLSCKKDPKMDSRKREQSKLRSQKYRDSLKLNTKKYESSKEKSRIRSRKRNIEEIEERKKNPEFKKVCQALWRNYKAKPKVVEWSEFIQSNSTDMPINVISQRRRRSKERQEYLLTIKNQKTESAMLKKKVKSLSVQLWKAKKLRSSILESKKMNCKPRVSTNVNTKKSHPKKTIVKRIRDEALRRKRASKVIWAYKMESFLTQDDISRQIPGSTILDARKINKNRKYKQKKGMPITKCVLRYRMINVFEKMKIVYPDYPYGFQQFSKMKPKYVVTAKKGTQKQKCICTYHSNINRKLNALNSFCKSNALEDLIIEKAEDLIEFTVCEHSNKFAARKCLERLCESCSVEKLMDHYTDILGNAALKQQESHWSKWTTVERAKYDNRKAECVQKKYNEIVPVCTTFEELLQHTMNDLKTFAMHDFRMRWQWQQLKDLQTNLPTNDAIVIMDFSENVPLQFSEETIASHVKNFSITLFPVAVSHHVNETVEQEAIIIFSDDHQHDSHSVRALTSIVMTHLKETYPDKKFNFVHRYSDGCASQFKSRHTMRDLRNFEEAYGCQIISNYGETSEFKNVCDGLGDHVKTPLKRAIIQQDLILPTPLSCFQYCKENMTFHPHDRGDHKMIRRSFYFLDKNNIDRTNEDTYGKPIPGLKL